MQTKQRTTGAQSHSPTHAQMKRQRREDNRRMGYSNPDYGQPILGELSPVELAHKARRAARRELNKRLARVSTTGQLCCYSLARVTNALSEIRLQHAQGQH